MSDRDWKKARQGTIQALLGLGRILVMLAAALSPPAAAQRVATGNAHTCAIADSGIVKCWGENYVGQLGNGTTNSASTAVNVVGLGVATALAAGDAHTCAIVAGGTVKCWGDNNFAQLGTGTGGGISSTPVDVIGLSGATALATGTYHTCAIVGSGAMKCWGYNGEGRLGNGTTVGSSSTPVDVASLGGAIALTAGDGHTCAIVTGGAVKCWGYNGEGRLGNGTTVSSSTPVDVIDLSGATVLAAGYGHTCAIVAGVAMKCWGMNFTGQIGNSTMTSSSTPVDVIGLGGALAVGAAGGHTCAIISGGEVKCWGGNARGQLGNGTTTNDSNPTPVAVVGLSSAMALAARNAQTCAIIADGSLKCWGSNNTSQLGNGVPGHSNIPVNVIGLSGVTALGGRCAISPGGAVRCWGGNYRSQLGDGTTNSGGGPPVNVIGLSDGTEMAAGRSIDYNCAIVAGGGVKCWGANWAGQLGNGTLDESNVPVGVIGLNGATALATGDSHTCAVVFGGAVKCWGANWAGQLGNGTINASNIAVDVIGLSGVTAIAAGYGHTCAIVASGTVRCWGYNTSRQLGSGTTTNTSTPVNVVGLSGATALTLGGNHTCAVVSGGAVKCWGFNGYGNLGNGTTTNVITLVDVLGISGATALASNGDSTCAIVAGGAVKCWGLNNFSQLGSIITAGISSTPVDVFGLSGVTALTASCAIVSGGAVKCWGEKGFGLLGNGSTAYYPHPQRVIGSPFRSDTSMASYPDDGLLGDGSSVSFTVLVSAGESAAKGLHLIATPSSALANSSWTCVPLGGATCPSVAWARLSDGSTNSSLDVNFDLPPFGALRFVMIATIDTSTGGGFADLTTRLVGVSLPPGGLGAVTSAPIYGDGLFKSGYEASGQ